MTGKVQGQQYFFKGCPLSCKWCHNPETQSYKKGLLFYAERCTGCRACMEECPQGAVSVKNGKVFTEAGRCNGCETCIDICVNNAREICGKTYGIQELQKKLRNYINYPVYIGG